MGGREEENLSFSFSSLGKRWTQIGEVILKNHLVTRNFIDSFANIPLRLFFPEAYVNPLINIIHGFWMSLKAKLDRTHLTSYSK